MKHKILLVSHIFNKKDEIGGERIVKIAKCLSSHFKIDLLVSSLDNNVDLPFVQRAYMYEHFYPRILTRRPVSLIERVSYKVQLLIAKIRSKGTPYDKGIFDRKSFTLALSNYLDTTTPAAVIVSVAPFSLATYVLSLAQTRSIKTIIDMRDPYTWGSGYGMKIISSRRFKHEVSNELFIMENADYILVPTQLMLNHLSKTYQNLSEKFKFIPHSIDLSDPANDNNRSDIQRSGLIFGGTIYDGTERTLSHSIGLFIKGGFNVSVYSAQHENLNLSQTTSGVNLFPLIDRNSFLMKLKSSQAYLAVFPDRHKDVISTKFIEIIFHKIPIVLICESGELSRFIVDNGLGIHILPKNLTTGVVDVIDKLKNFIPREFQDIENYTWEAQAIKITALING